MPESLHNFGKGVKALVLTEEADGAVVVVDIDKNVVVVGVDGAVVAVDVDEVVVVVSTIMHIPYFLPPMSRKL